MMIDMSIVVVFITVGFSLAAWTLVKLTDIDKRLSILERQIADKLGNTIILNTTKV